MTRIPVFVTSLVVLVVLAGLGRASALDAQAQPRGPTAAGPTAAAGPAAAQSLFDQADTAFMRDQLARAFRLAERAAAADSARGDFQLLLGDIACARAGAVLGSPMGRRCGAAYRRAVALAPDSLDYQEALAGWMELAPRRDGGGRDSALAARLRARDELRGTALESDILWRAGGRARRRADALMSALGAAHAGERRFVLRVADYWSETRRPDSALAACSRLVDRDPLDVVAQFFLGRQMVIMKRDPSLALQHLIVAASVATPPPEDVGGVSYSPGAPWWRMAQAYEQMGKADSARDCFEEALSLTPGMPEAQSSLDSLKRPRPRRSGGR